MPTGFPKKYNICGENNPHWLIAEPILFNIWADGILKSKFRNLHGVNLIGWLISVPPFLGGLVLRASFVASFLFICYLIFPQTLTMSFDLIFSGNQMGSDLWVYQLLGYVIIIKSTLLIFGDNFKDFIVESILCLLFFLTNMLPLRYLAKGLKKESYVAQLIAKKPLMGMLVVQFVGAMPSDSISQWDKVFNLYKNSNHSASREELEGLAEEHAKRKI